jgi:hypothetical protein
MRPAISIIPRTRMRFNPTRESSNLFVPGLMAFVLTIISSWEKRYLGSYQPTTVVVTFDPAGGKTMVKMEDITPTNMAPLPESLLSIFASLHAPCDFFSYGYPHRFLTRQFPIFCLLIRAFKASVFLFLLPVINGESLQVL